MAGLMLLLLLLRAEVGRRGEIRPADFSLLLPVAERGVIHVSEAL